MAKEKIIFYDFITYVIIPKQNNEGVTTTPIQAINIIFYLEVYFVNYGLYTWMFHKKQLFKVLSDS